MPAVTAKGDDDQWVNKETASAAKAIYKRTHLHKMLTEILYTCANAGAFTDKLEALMWILWDSKIPDSHAETLAVDWSQIANRIIDDNGISWEDLQKSLDK